jgi:energy-converting hydrogenase Eha subunit A
MHYYCHVCIVTNTLAALMTAHHTAALMLLPLVNRKFPHNYVYSTHHPVPKETYCSNTTPKFSDYLHCRYPLPYTHS